MPSLLERFRRGRPAGDESRQELEPPGEDVSPAADPAPPPAPPKRRPLPPAGVLRRQRRTLLRDREERIRDLGGLVLEMYRQDRFRQDLVYEQAAQVVAIEERLFQVDQLLALATSRGRVSPAQACPQCGAPVYPGARFCASCGNALAAAQP